MMRSNHGDGTKYDSTVVKMGSNENTVVTFTVVLLFHNTLIKSGTSRRSSQKPMRVFKSLVSKIKY